MKKTLFLKKNLRKMKNKMIPQLTSSIYKKFLKTSLKVDIILGILKKINLNSIMFKIINKMIKNVFECKNKKLLLFI